MDARNLNLDPRQDDEGCPPGSKYYICQNSLFNGCCSVDPCNSNSCPDGNEKEGDDDGKGATVTDDPEATTETDNGDKDRETSMVTVTVPILTGSSLAESITTSSARVNEPQLTITATETVGESILSPTVAPHTGTVETSATGIPTSDESAGQVIVQILSPGAIAGIIVGAIVAALILAGSTYFFLSRRKKTVVPQNSFPLQDLGTPHTDHSVSRVTRDFNDPYGAPYDEPVGGFTRASAFKPSNMRNHPVNAETRKSGDNKPATSVTHAGPERAATPKSRTSESGSTRSNPFSDSHRVNSRTDLSQSEPDLAFTLTPELCGPLETAKLVELRQQSSLPKFINIGGRNAPAAITPSTSTPREYRPYRPGVRAQGNAQPAGIGRDPSASNADTGAQARAPTATDEVQVQAPSTENGPAGPAAHGVRGDLNATEDDRENKNYVNSWTTYDPDTTR